MNQMELSIESFTYWMSPQEAARLAKQRELQPVWPDEHTIMLDIDSEEDYQKFMEMSPILNETFGIYAVRQWRSKSGNRHIVLHSHQSVTPIERIAFQACCGSDRKRELLALHLLRRGIEEPTVLFRPVSGDESGDNR